MDEESVVKVFSYFDCMRKMGDLAAEDECPLISVGEGMASMRDEASSKLWSPSFAIVTPPLAEPFDTSLSKMMESPACGGEALVTNLALIGWSC